MYTAASSLATVPRIASGIVSLVYLAEVACRMVLWGFACASPGKSRACQNACCTVPVVVALLSPLVHWGTLEGPGEQVAQAVIIGALCALVLLATFVMSLLLDYRQQDELTRRFEMENRELSSALYREIAREFKLSDRELQIMALLAEGYSRTYIRDSYCCSHCKRA